MDTTVGATVAIRLRTMNPTHGWQGGSVHAAGSGGLGMVEGGQVSADRGAHGRRPLRAELVHGVPGFADQSRRPRGRSARL